MSPIFLADRIRTILNGTSLIYGDAVKIARIIANDAAPFPAAIHYINANGGNPHRWESPFTRIRRTFA